MAGGVVDPDAGDQGRSAWPASLVSLLDFGGRVAVVTGGAAGIGAAICRQLAQAGARVVVFDLPGAGAPAMAQELISAPEGRQHDTAALGMEGDVRDAVAVRGVMDTALDHFGGLDVLVNCAGVYPSIPALEMTEQQWDDIIDINLKGTFLCTQAFGMARRERPREGVVVNIASRAGVRARPGVLAYSAAKAGVVSLTQGLAQELAPLGIRVNAVAPGPIQTGRTASAAAARVAGGDTTAEAWQAAYRARIPLGRYGSPEEVAMAVTFLASPASSYVTGAVLIVDGGATLP